MISIVVPVYNVEKYLRECLDSLLGQEFQDCEILLVNDGSTDLSPAICQEYAARDGRVRVIHQENQGLSAARNTGIEAAQGEYLLFVDSDDYLPEGALSTLHALAVEHHADFVAGIFLRLLENGNIRPARLRDPIHGAEVYTGDAKMDNYIRVPKQTNSVTGKLFARELFREIRFPVGKLFEDVFVTYRLVHAAKCLVLTETPSYVYRKRAGSIAMRPCTDRDYDAVEGRLQEEAFVLKHYPEMEHHTHVRVFSTVFQLVIRSAFGRIQDPEKRRNMQRLVRRYLRNYLKCRAARKKKLLAILAFVHLDLARLAVKLYMKNLAEEDV